MHVRRQDCPWFPADSPHFPLRAVGPLFYWRMFLLYMHARVPVRCTEVNVIAQYQPPVKVWRGTPQANGFETGCFTLITTSCLLLRTLRPDDPDELPPSREGGRVNTTMIPTLGGFASNCG